MTSKLNNAWNSTVIRRKIYQIFKKIHMQCQRRQCFMDIQSETYRPNPTLYDKLICKNLKNMSPLTASVGGKWENVEFSFSPIPIKPFPFP